MSEELLSSSGGDSAVKEGSLQLPGNDNRRPELMAGADVGHPSLVSECVCGADKRLQLVEEGACVSVLTRQS